MIWRGEETTKQVKKTNHNKNNNIGNNSKNNLIKGTLNLDMLIGLKYYTCVLYPSDFNPGLPALQPDTSQTMQLKSTLMVALI